MHTVENATLGLVVRGLAVRHDFLEVVQVRVQPIAKKAEHSGPQKMMNIYHDYYDHVQKD